MNIRNVIYKSVDLITAMDLPPISNFINKSGYRTFYDTKLSNDEIFKKLDEGIERIYFGDDCVFNLPPDNEQEEVFAKPLPADNEYKIKRLKKWVDDAFNIKKDAKNKADEEKINAIQKWIADKIKELSGTKPTVRMLALYYVYLHNSKEEPTFQIRTNTKNKKQAFSIFAEEILKIGKNSLILKYGLFDNEVKRRDNATVEELQVVIKMLEDNNYSKALATAKQEFRMIELRKK